MLLDQQNMYNGEGPAGETAMHCSSYPLSFRLAKPLCYSLRQELASSDDKHFPLEKQLLIWIAQSPSYTLPMLSFNTPPLFLFFQFPFKPLFLVKRVVMVGGTGHTIYEKVGGQKEGRGWINPERGENYLESTCALFCLPLHHQHWKQHSCLMATSGAHGPAKRHFSHLNNTELI